MVDQGMQEESTNASRLEGPGRLEILKFEEDAAVARQLAEKWMM